MPGVVGFGANVMLFVKDHKTEHLSPLGEVLDEKLYDLPGHKNVPLAFVIVPGWALAA